MRLQTFVEQVLRRVDEELRLSLEGSTLEELAYRPTPEANSMAWLAWHIARMQDVRSSLLSGRDQLWISEGWHASFGLPPDPDDTGRGHTAEQVAEVRPKTPETLRDYCRAAYERALGCVQSLAPEATDREVEGREDAGATDVDTILLGMVQGGLAHVGQLAYVRGLIERRIWFPR